MDNRFVVSRTIEMSGKSRNISVMVDAPTMDEALTMYQVIRLQDVEVETGAALVELSARDESRP